MRSARGSDFSFSRAFFSHGAGPVFTSTSRKYDIYFHYPWSEQDKIIIELPDGFSLDNADAPAPITPDMTKNICGQKIKLSVTKDGRTLMYDRDFFFGGGGSILFPSEGYAAVKQLFDLFGKANDHTITLKQNATN